jgi:hypothetical protein
MTGFSTGAWRAVRGYYREREKLIDMWDAHERNRDPKK